MNLALIVALLLVCAMALGIARTWPVHLHRPVRIGLQIIAAWLLYFCLFPPLVDEDYRVDELTVVTPGATHAQLAALRSVASVVALPGADVDAAIERVPDLGTALRLHAGTRRLRIVGGGLPARDRDAARGLVAAFDAAPLPRGLVGLDAPTSVLVGNVWRIDGRVEAVNGGRVELRDPAGAVVSAQGLDAQGRFTLHAEAKGEGAALFLLTVFDRNGTQVDAASVPLSVRGGSPLKVVMLAGAPDAELKYFRRWAADVGLALSSRIALSDGVALNEGAAALDDAVLRASDIAIVDERAWAALDATRKQALIAATRDGLGLLLRVTGPVPEPIAADWAKIGFHIRTVDAATPVALDKTLGLGDSGVVFERHAFAVDAIQAAPLLRADDGSTLAWTRNLGRGRVAIWSLAGSYRLALGGATAAYGTLWGGALSTVARAHEELSPALPTAARVDERAVLCGLSTDAAVVDEKGGRLALWVGADRCAGYWPQAPGWHVLTDASGQWPFHVRAREDAPGLMAADDERATRMLLGTSASTAEEAMHAVPLPRWPFFLAWLIAVAVLWWLERGTAVNGDTASGGQY